MEGVHLNIHCTRVYIKKYATYLSSCMVPDIISLVAKKSEICVWIYIACSNSQQRLMPPFTSDLQMPLSRVQIDECTSYEFESSKPPLCWIRHVFYFVASNLECIHASDKCIKCFTLTTWSALINVYIWIAKASIACISNRSHSMDR